MPKSLQQEIASGITKKFKDAVIKKIDKDNYLDIHLPSVNPNKGTHLGINTANDLIKIVFYCRDKTFNKHFLTNSKKIEEYSQGIRIKGNPAFNNAVKFVDVAVDFVLELLRIAKDVSVNQIKAKKSEKIKLPRKKSNKQVRLKEEGRFETDTFQVIHTLVIVYSAFARQSGIADSSLDVLINRIKLWDFQMTDEEKNTEIMRGLKWFTKHYEPSLFSRLKIKLNELTTLPAKRRMQIAEDLRAIANTFFEVTKPKIELYASLITNLGLKLTEFRIESASNELIEKFNNQFDIEQKSMVLETFREEGTIVLLSIDVSDMSKAIENDDFSDRMLHLIGKTDLGDWNSVQKLTTKNEANKIRKDFKGVKPDYIVLLYCQGNYIHALSSD